MPELEDLHRWGESLVNDQQLKSLPIGLKFLSSEDEVPPASLRPFRDKKQHLAQCQAFAMARRQGLSVTMTREDHWCWGPVLGYGLADHRPALTLPATRFQAETLPRLELNRYYGLTCAPLSTINFIPDLVLIYSNTAQLRSLMMALKHKEQRLIESQFDPIDSCVYSVVPVMLLRQARITLPDPGECHRATAEDDEIILSLPIEKLPILMDGLELTRRFTLASKFTENLGMQPDFPRPDFYNRLFELWGMK